MLFQVALALFAALMITAIATDFTKLRIPNWISIGLVAAWALYAISPGVLVPVLPSLAYALGALVLAFVLFCFEVWGGGDAKLFTAAALWVGPHSLEFFVVLTVILGGAESLLMLTPLGALQVRLAHGTEVAATTTPRKRVIPYGIAIALAALITVFFA